MAGAPGKARRRARARFDASVRRSTSGPSLRLNASTSLTDFNPATFNSANGDGSWTYPGEHGLLYSTRLVALRDGVEDWQLLQHLPPSTRASLVTGRTMMELAPSPLMPSS